MTIRLRLTPRSAAVIAVLALVAAFALNPFGSTAGAKHTDDHQPANKLAVAGAGNLIEAPDEEATLLTTTMKNPGSKALVLSVTLECSILTDLTTVGNDLSEAEAKAEVWVEVNGETVAVSDDPASGRVTFCEREYQRETRMWEDEEAVIDDFIRTKASHGFNWVALHDGSGDKVIEVKAELTRNSTDNAVAALVIGHRTLIVEPADVSHDETLSN